MNRLLLALAIAAGASCAALLFWHHQWQNPFRVPIARQLKLLEIRNDSQEARFIL
jgi:hypothetical protein